MTDSVVTRPPMLNTAYSTEIIELLEVFSSVLQARDYSCQVIGPAVIGDLPHNLLEDIQNMRTLTLDYWYFGVSDPFISASVYETFVEQQSRWNEAFAPL